MRTPSSSRVRAVWIALLGLLGMALLSAPAASANVNAFSYAYWGSDYTISLDDEGRAHAHVVETLVARFPDYDQNRGIVRGLDTHYQGSSLHIRVLSITDEHGDPVPYWTESEEGTLLLLLGTDDYVHGLNTYVIEYEMRDVMLAASETEKDEFYWNLLPLRSSQWIEQFEGTVTFSPPLATAFSGDAVCYEGYSGSTERCTMSGPSFSDDGMGFAMSGIDLPPGYGVSVAVGFTAGTVTQPAERRLGPALDAAPYLALGAGGVVTIIGGVALARSRRRARRATGIVVAQYEVPRDVPPLLAAAIIPQAKSIIPAQMVHLAVNDVIRIESFSKSSRPRLHLVAPERAYDPLDAQLRDVIFKGGGGAFTVPRSSESFANNMRALTAKGVTEAVRRGYLVKKRSPGARVAMWIALGFIGLSVLMTLVGVILGRPQAPAAIFVTVFGGLILLAFALGVGARHNTHTPQGAALYEHLSGVREFIRVAEADRLRFLQSVHGAEHRVWEATEVVHLYELLLPYAMLFGEEKSWGRVLETSYQSTGGAPQWFSSSGSGGFTTQFSSFASTARSSSSYSPSSSGSGGGSGGGGSSGGGGGGGSSGGR